MVNTFATASLLRTGQTSCHGVDGRNVECSGSGQDGEFRVGRPWPEPRFEDHGELVVDLLTGLMWTGDANGDDFPLTWQEALAAVAAMNRRQTFGFADWRLPNRRELRSLISYQISRPVLPPGHPFRHVYRGWYWTSTSAAINPAYAWYIHLDGGRMFYGRKDQEYFYWPVRGEPLPLLPASGQRSCFDSAGRRQECAGSGQDGECLIGRPWPDPRFLKRGEVVLDRLTNLYWLAGAGLGAGPLTWAGALEAVNRLNEAEEGDRRWRPPNINELESLVDCSRHTPALPAAHPFGRPEDGYWSATTSMFEPDWAWVLYLNKGATGVGYKPGKHFHAWPVSSG